MSEGKTTLGRDKHRWEVHINIHVMKYEVYVRLICVARNINCGRLVRAWYYGETSDYFKRK